VILALGERQPVLEGGGHFIADNARVIGTVRLKDRASVWFGCVLRGDNDWIEVGERSNIQDACILHTDPGTELVVGSGVTVGHRATLHGCRIGDDSLVGIGATLLNGASIGRHCIVGAGALLLENREYPDGSLIVGSPARVVRPVSEQEIADIRRSADAYARNAQRFSEQLAISAPGDWSVASPSSGQ
jgi:carbonic anhydrase/acetyltransferase-like protein (isoleucine patch superfamily)